MDKFWNDLLFNVCGGNASDMVGLRKFEIIDFFDFVESKKHGRS
jgi:hypothetical protein